MHRKQDITLRQTHIASSFRWRAFVVMKKKTDCLGLLSLLKAVASLILNFVVGNDVNLAAFRQRLYRW